MTCSTVEALFETDPKLWPNSSSYCPDLLDKMINTVMDQGWYNGTGGVNNGLTTDERSDARGGANDRA